MLIHKPNQLIADTTKSISQLSGIPVLVLCKNHTEKNKPIFIQSTVPKGLSSKLSAGDWVKHVAQFLGGSGGGKGEVAAAYGVNLDLMEEAKKVATQFANSKL